MNLTSLYLCAQPDATHVKYTSAQPFTPKFVKDHLTKKLPSFRAQALYDERVHRRQLGFARRIQSQRTKAEKEKKKGLVKRVKMGRREAAEMGVWQLRREEARCVPQRPGAKCTHADDAFLFSSWIFRWDAFVPLHRLWLGYMSELLGLTMVDTLGQEQEGQRERTAHAMPSATGMHAKLVKADFHGSIMTGLSIFSCLRVLFGGVDAGAGYDDAVRRSKNASLVGASGIVVQETENTFKVVTQKNKLKGERLLSFVVCVSCVLTGMHPSILFFYSAAKARVHLCFCRSSV